MQFLNRAVVASRLLLGLTFALGLGATACGREDDDGLSCTVGSPQYQTELYFGRDRAGGVPARSADIDTIREEYKSLPPLCPLTECMRLLGGAWTANIVWRLSGDPRRFSELRSDIPRISAKVLSAKLRALEENGVLTRPAVASSPPSVEYALTALGRELIPVIETIVQVGMKLQRMEQATPLQGSCLRTRCAGNRPASCGYPAHTISDQAS